MSFATLLEMEPAPNTLGKGVGEYSRQLRKTEEEVFHHATEPLISGGWKRLLVDEAFEIYIECSEPGWDGYDAAPLSEGSFFYARSFIDLIPVWAPRPDLVPSPDGWISFEWRSLMNRIMSATPENGVLIYAAALGHQNVHYGRVSLEEYREKLPSNLTRILSEYFRNERTSF
ncbi:MAG: hypothetical protein F4Z24_01155 [Nitrospira sp. SB0666_bin_27]|nr:hypothetical protein [Nitrospira sp. SB0666_bin_27]MYF25705.1 hypothetical protein [Nitrospira sp. SB0678_bin_10]